MRKIIQLAAATRTLSIDADGLRDLEQEVLVTALCDDGSAWFIRPGQDNSKWECLPRIPQHVLLHDWRVEVGKCLTQNHLFRQDAIEAVLDEQRASLVAKYEARMSPVQAARELAKEYA